jgi:hypothetical protein
MVATLGTNSHYGVKSNDHYPSNARATAFGTIDANATPNQTTTIDTLAAFHSLAELCSLTTL